MTTRGTCQAWGAIVVTVCVITATAQEPTPAPPSQQFQEAVTLMEGRGDCRAASPVFERVAQGSDRSLAARSLVYLGTCHERLGRAQAAATYRRVIDGFPDQRTAVAEARRRLAALSPPASARPPRTPTLRQTWLQRPSFIASGGGASVDGRVLAFVDTDGGVSLTDLDSAKTRRQMAIAGEGSVGLKPVPSPDGTAVVFSWIPPKGGAAELRLSHGVSNPARVLLQAAPGESLLVLDWPLDDRLLLEITRVDGRVSLHVLRIADKTLTPVAELRHHPGAADMSPDGRWIAYDRPAADGRARDIVVTPSVGGVARVVVDAPSDDFAPAWAPRGDQLLFVSDRSGSTSLWALAMRNGAPAGPGPTLLQRDIGILASLVGVTTSGAYHYNRQIGLVDVFVQGLDESGRPSGQARATSQTALGGNLMPSFAADSRTLIHVSGMSTSDGALDEFDLALGSSRTMRSGLDYIRQPRWSADGRYLFAKGVKGGGRFGIYNVDLGAGRADPVVTVPSDEETELGAFTWLATVPGTIAYVRGAATVRRLTISSNEDARWFDMEGVTRIVALAASPSDERIAMIGLRGQAHALFVREPNGVARDLVTVAAGEGQIQSLAWTSDGQSLLYTRRHGTDRVAALWRVAAAGGTPEALGVQAEGMRDLAVSPDGRHIAWTAGYPRREPWVLEHVIRPSAVAR